MRNTLHALCHWNPLSMILWGKYSVAPFYRWRHWGLERPATHPQRHALTTVAVSLLFHYLHVFLDLQNEVAIHQMEWFLKEHGMLASRFPAMPQSLEDASKHHLFLGAQRLVPCLRVYVLRLFPSSLPSWGMSQGPAVTSEAQVAQGCGNQ